LRNRVIIKVPYRFVYASRDKLWGVIPTWVTPNEQVQVSDMERTILDGLSRPELCSGISEVATGLWLRKDDLDWEKLTFYCKKLGNQAVAKRLGYLLELYDLGLSQINQLQEMVGPSYALLDPTLMSEGTYVARWRLRINIDPEILKGIVTT
jgi:predicted transcriptional regulator of viral defense system